MSTSDEFKNTRRPRLTRRNLLQALGLSGAAAALTSLTPQAANATESGSLDWYEQPTANVREANEMELKVISRNLRKFAQEFHEEMDHEARIIATVSATSRGTTMWRATTALENDVVILQVSEVSSRGSILRTESLGYLAAPQAIKVIAPEDRKLADKTPIAMASCCVTCCYGCNAGAVGKCCTYDWQHLFECCFPCAFGGPTAWTLACAVVWCNYCFWASCTSRYRCC